MTALDTTRLRALAEAVRNAGAKSVYAHDVVVRLVDSGHSDITSARDEACAASEVLRGAEKALYADAPPDGIILALLDEVDRLRKIFDDAGQGEHNVLALVEHYQQAAMDADERAALAYPRALQAAAYLALDCAATWRAAEESCEMNEIGDSVEALADRILELSVEDIEAIDARENGGAS